MKAFFSSENMLLLKQMKMAHQKKSTDNGHL